MMPQNEEEIRNTILEINDKDPMLKHIGMEMLELSYQHSKSRMKLSENIINSYGIAHGGAILTMADATAGYAACMCGYFVATISGTLNFLSAGRKTEYIYCECNQLKAGKTIIVYEVRIKDDNGKLLDSGEYTYHISSNPIIKGSID